jgi:hypothetical protein
MQVEANVRTYDYTSSDPKQYRYWSPTAQKYASGDQLARCLQEGYCLDTVVETDTHWFGEARYITVYTVKLHRDDEHITMRVLGNPFAKGLFNDERLGLQQIACQDKQSVRFEVVGK